MVTVVMDIIAILLFTMLLLLMYIWYTNGTDVTVGCLDTVSIHNFVLVRSCDLLQDVLRATV